MFGKFPGTSIAPILHFFQCGVAINGCRPLSTLIEGSDGWLYGTTAAGGTEGQLGGGTVFKIAVDGTSFTVLHSFLCGVATDGCTPLAGVLEGSDGFLYSTTQHGGASDGGTVFRLAPDGTGFTLIASLACDDSCEPQSPLIQGRDGRLYGTTAAGGCRGGGTIFRLVVPDPTPTALETSITAAPANPSPSPVALFRFTATDADSLFDCQLDNEAYVACTSPQIYTHLSAGSHTFHVRARDLANHVDPTPASYAWDIDLATSDTLPPQLLAFSFTPSTIDVSQASQRIVTIRAELLDDLSGIAFGSVTFRSLSSGQSRNAGIGFTRGDFLHGTFEGSVVFPPESASGVWTVSNVTIGDVVGNTTFLDTASLTAAGFPTVLTVANSAADTEAPKVTALSMSPETIDVSAGAQQVLITLHLTDNHTGVVLGSSANCGDFTIRFRSPSGAHGRFVECHALHLRNGGTLQDGLWQGTMTMPRFSEPGAWQLSVLDFFDGEGNRTFLTAADLSTLGLPTALQVTSNPADITPPTLGRLSVTPAVINTSDNDQEVRITLRVLDDLAGVDFAPVTPRATFLSRWSNSAVLRASRDRARDSLHLSCFSWSPAMCTMVCGRTRLSSPNSARQGRGTLSSSL